MEQVSKQQPVNKTAFRVLVALSVTHCLNDSLQSVISAVYPLFKDDLALSFAQIRVDYACLSIIRFCFPAYNRFDF